MLLTAVLLYLGALIMITILRRRHHYVNIINVVNIILTSWHLVPWPSLSIIWSTIIRAQVLESVSDVFIPFLAIDCVYVYLGIMWVSGRDRARHSNVAFSVYGSTGFWFSRLASIPRALWSSHHDFTRWKTHSTPLTWPPLLLRLPSPHHAAQVSINLQITYLLYRFLSRHRLLAPLFFYWLLNITTILLDSTLTWPSLTCVLHFIYLN